MDMKDQVKLKLSLRQLSRVYHSIDPQTNKHKPSSGGSSSNQPINGKTATDLEHPVNIDNLD